MNTGKLILGILAGAAIGASLGVLYAPAEGSKTRKKISAKKDAYLTGMENKYNAFVNTVTGKFDAMKQEASNMVDTRKTAMQDGLSKASTAVK